MPISALPRVPARLLNLLLAIAIALTPSASLAEVSAAPVVPAGPAQALQQAGDPLSVTKRDALAADQDGDGRADPGDALRYTVVLSNTGASDATGVSVADTLDSNTSLVPGSLQVSPLAFSDSATTARDTPLSVAAPGLLANDTGSPVPAAAPFSGATSAGGSVTVAADGGFSYTPPPGFVGDDSFPYTAANPLGSDSSTVTIAVRLVATAADDAFALANGSKLSGNLLANDEGAPPLAVLSFGDALATVGDVPADGVSVLSMPAGGGAIEVTVAASGVLRAETVGTAGSGEVAFFYAMQAGDGSTDTARVTIRYEARAPHALADAFQRSVGALDSSGSVTANDDRGAPLADVTGFGGGSLGGAVGDNAAGATAAIPGSGDITVSLAADGALTVDATARTAAPGVYTFDYQLDNGAGAAVATVTLNVVQGPVARDDTFAFSLPGFLSGDLTADNGSGADTPGTPAYDQLSFGGGSLGGAVSDNAAGVSVPFAGGTLAVNLDGSFALTNATVPGTYTFQYRLASTAIPASDDATVTIEVRQAPVAQDDPDLVAAVGATVTFAAGALFADNGAGADTLGTPAATLVSFGAGSIAGSTLVTDFAAGATTGAGSFAGGTLTVNGDGSLSVNNPTLSGTFSFVYRIQNAAGFAEATATVTVQEGPVAQDDSFAGGFTSGPGGLALSGDLFVANGGAPDLLGTPAATLTSFGGGSLGGTVTSNAAGASVALAGGTLTVNGDGTFALASATTAGTFTLEYRIANALGSDDATVMLTIDAAPTVSGTAPVNGAVDVPPGSDIVVSFSEPVAVTAGGISVSCSLSGAVAGALSGSGSAVVTFNPSADLPGGETCAVTVAASGVADSDANDQPDNLAGDYSFSFQVAPTANDDAYTVTPHLTFASPAGVRGNDGPASATITGFGATLATANGTVPNGTNFITAGDAGGRVVLSADGAFAYYPDAGDTSPAAATFFYTIAGGDTAQVTLTFESEELIWFVDNTPAATVCTGANVGAQACPAADLATVAAVDTPNDAIYLAAGAYPAGITLEADERLIGDGLSGNLAAFTGVSPAPGSSLPDLSGAAPLLTTTTSGRDAIELATDNIIRGLTVGDVGVNGDATDIGGWNFGTLTLESVALSGTGQALNLNNGTLDATLTELTSTRSGGTTSGAGFFDVAGSLTTPSTTISDAAGYGIQSHNSTASLSFGTTSITRANNRSITLTNNTGTLTFGATTISALDEDGVYISGGAPTVQFGATTISQWLRDDGSGIAIRDVTGGSITFASATLIEPGYTGIDVYGTSAPVTINGGAITDALSDSIVVASGNGNFTYAGTIEGDLARLVTVVGTTGGAKSFTGAISDGGNSWGIYLNDNTGATISFSGGLTLSTGVNPAFRALGGGTVVVTGANNTIATTTGTALNVTNTTIGAAGLTFRSISAGTAASGPANGIVLNNTGLLGGLTVTGSSAGLCGGQVTGGGATVTPPNSADCTGGAILNSIGAGIVLASTSDLSLTRMRIAGGGDDGISGTNVADLTLTASLIEGNGNAVGERGIELSNLTGSGGISASTIRGSAESNISITNAGGTLSAFNITNSQIATTSFVTGDDGILFLNNGSGAMTISVTESAFTDNKGDHFQAATSASATGLQQVTFSNNTLLTTAANDPNVIGGGITVNPGGSADLTFVISNNNIQQAFDEAININHDPSSTPAGALNGTILGNTIGTAGVLDSGSESSNGITVSSKGNGPTTVAIIGNTVRQWSNLYGIIIDNAEGSSLTNVTLTGNSLKSPGTFASNGIHVMAGATAGPPADAGTICVAMTNNDATTSGAGGSTDIRLRQRFNTTIRLPGYSGANNDTAAVNSFITSNNLGGPTVSSLHNVGGGGGGFVGGAPCTLPAAGLLAGLPGAAVEPAQAASFPLSIGTLPAGKAVTISFEVAIADPLPAGAALVANQATVSADGLTDTVSDDPDTPAPGDPTIMPLDVGIITLHLPLVVRAAGMPDLVVERIVAEGGALQLVIRNQGAAPVSDPFWVDLYIAPEAAPTAVNQVWRTQGAQGATWGVTGAALPLAPGAALTLTLGGAYYRADLSNVGAPIAAGTALYAQADSANTLTTYGGVLEAHEQAGGPYNNIAGPVAAASLVARPQTTGALAGALPGLPARPAR